MSASVCARVVVSLVRALERGTLATSAAFLTGERVSGREREWEREKERDESCRRWESKEGRFNKVECQEKKQH